MQIRLVMAGVLLMTAPATAQKVQIDRRPVAVEKIIRPSGNPDLYEVASDGTVYVDWQLVDNMAAAPPSFSQHALAQMMLAIRDGKTKDRPPQR